MTASQRQNDTASIFSVSEPTLSDTVSETLLFLRRRLLRIVLSGLLFSSLALVVSLNMDRMYKSSIQLMIERPLASPIDAEQVQVMRLDNGYIDGQVLQIRSDDLLLKVVERAELTEHPFFQAEPPSLMARTIRAVKSIWPGMAPVAQNSNGGIDPADLTALKTLSEAVAVRREGDTNVVSIEVRTTSPTLAMTIATTIAETYRDMRLEQRDASAREMSIWIDGRASELRADLVAAENAVTGYRIENGLIGDVNGATLGDQQLTELNAELIRSNADLVQKRASFELAQAMLAGNGDLSSLPEVQNSDIISALRETRLQLQRSEQDISQIGGSDNPRLAQIRRQAVLVDTQIDQEILRIASVLENETRALESRTNLLMQALERAGGESELETQSTVELRELERIVEAYRLRYERYLNNAGLASELQSFAFSGTQVVKSANFPTSPFYPPTKVLLVLGFLFGVALAILSALVKEALAKGYGSAAQIERDLGLKVLTILPEVNNLYVGPSILNSDPFSPFSEAVSVLRQRLRLSAPSLSDHLYSPVLVITSAEEGDGKTSASVAIAVSASAAGQKVLLVDGDLRYAGLSELFDMDGGDGFCDILRGQPWRPSVGLRRSVLDIMPAGALDGKQPTDLLETRYLRNFLDVARRSYDLVVVDAPPVANLADSLILAEISSQVVFVLRAEKSPKEAVQNSLNMLPRAKMAGVIVNRVDPKDMSGRWINAKLYSTSKMRSASIYQLRNVGPQGEIIAKPRLVDGAA